MSGLSDAIQATPEGWLFLTGGSNVVVSLYQRAGGLLPDEQLETWRALIEARAARCSALGAICLHVVVPDKLTIYADLPGAPLVDAAQAPAARLAQMMADSPAAAAYLDLVPALQAARATHPVYWRTDSHWTPEGCHAAYLEICRHLGLTPAAGLLQRARATRERVMDLAAHLPDPRPEIVHEYAFAETGRRVWVNSVTRCLENPLYREIVHGGARARFENPNAPARVSMMTFGDSYARPDQRALTGLLAETVSSLEFVWSSQVDWRLVARRRPQIVLFEIAERFLVQTPQDDVALWRMEARQLARAQQFVLARGAAACRAAAVGAGQALKRVGPRQAAAQALAAAERARERRWRKRLAFDPHYYRAAYPDLAALDHEALRSHFLNFGLDERRAGARGARAAERAALWSAPRLTFAEIRQATQKGVVFETLWPGEDFWRENDLLAAFRTLESALAPGATCFLEAPDARMAGPDEQGAGLGAILRAHVFAQGEAADAPWRFTPTAFVRAMTILRRMRLLRLAPEQTFNAPDEETVFGVVLRRR